MKLAVYGRSIVLEDFQAFFDPFLEALSKHGIEFCLMEDYARFVKASYGLELPYCTAEELLHNGYDALISLGGDGTVLDTLQLVRDSGIPVLGVNLGRFGFLASITVEEVDRALNQLKNGEFILEGRSVIEVDADLPEIKEFPYALNDFVVQKRDTSSMITVDTYLSGDFMNSYWSDGIILATPTGSSGYSLSCGGPLIFPGTQALVLTPIAAHNLTVRPAVLPDNEELRFEIRSRSQSVLVSLDSRSYKIPSNAQLTLRKAPFSFNMVRLQGITYMDTIRTKLMWGLDSRNKA